MLAESYPIRVLLMTLSGLVNRHQADVIAYLVEENRILKEQMKGKSLRLNNSQRRRLAAKAKLLVRGALNSVATIVTPDRSNLRVPAWPPSADLRPLYEGHSTVQERVRGIRGWKTAVEADRLAPHWSTLVTRERPSR